MSKNKVIVVQLPDSQLIINLPSEQPEDIYKEMNKQNEQTK